MPQSAPSDFGWTAEIWETESPILRASKEREQTRAAEKSGAEGVEALVGWRTFAAKKKSSQMKMRNAKLE